MTARRPDTTLSAHLPRDLAASFREAAAAREVSPSRLLRCLVEEFLEGGGRASGGRDDAPDPRLIEVALRVSERLLEGVEPAFIETAVEAVTEEARRGESGA